MYEEKLAGKLKQPIPKLQIQEPASDADLSSQANRAIDEYTAKAQGARHSYGKGIPADHPALGE